MRFGPMGPLGSMEPDEFWSTFDVDEVKVTPSPAIANSEPLFGDWLLKERGITVIDGGQRGQTLPERTPLTALKPIYVPTDPLFISLKQLHEVVLQVDGGFFAPWGRDLAWRIFNDVTGEGEAFLATLNQKYCYYFAGDHDLLDIFGRPVMSYLGYKKNQWGLSYNYLIRGVWAARTQVFALDNSPV